MIGLDLVPRADWSVTVRPRPGMVEVRTPTFPFVAGTARARPTGGREGREGIRESGA